MGWLSWLFGPRGPEPVLSVVDPVFGPLKWSEDDESWIGDCGGYEIAIGYSLSAVPDGELLAHVREFLGPNGAAIAPRFKAAQAESEHASDELAAEFAGLRVGKLFFSKSGQQMRCFAELVGGERDRCWRAEFDGMKCLGFGFDT